MGSSSLTWERTWVSCIGSVESGPLGHQGSPTCWLLKIFYPGLKIVIVKGFALALHIAMFLEVLQIVLICSSLNMSEVKHLFKLLCLFFFFVYSYIIFYVLCLFSAMFLVIFFLQFLRVLYILGTSALCNTLNFHLYLGLFLDTILFHWSPCLVLAQTSFKHEDVIMFHVLSQDPLIFFFSIFKLLSHIYFSI